MRWFVREKFLLSELCSESCERFSVFHSVMWQSSFLCSFSIILYCLLINVSLTCVCLKDDVFVLLRSLPRRCCIRNEPFRKWHFVNCIPLLPWIPPLVVILQLSKISLSPSWHIGRNIWFFWQQFDGLTLIFGCPAISLPLTVKTFLIGQSHFLVRVSKGTIKMNQPVIFGIYFLTYNLSGTCIAMVRRELQLCASGDLITNTCSRDKQHLFSGMMCRIVCQCWGWQIKKLSSNTVSKFFTLQRGKQRWHSSPWLMNMAENQASSESNIITDNNNYAINLSLATQDNRGKQDFCEQRAFRQPAVGKLPQVPDRWSHL